MQGCFDTIDHQWMLRMLEQRIDDKPCLRLIPKWLKAGMLEEDGKGRHPATGTPQGGVVSPLLANVSVHYALDRWWERVGKKDRKGAVSLCRYADDFVWLLQYKEDAERLYHVLPQRLGKCNLHRSTAKTRIIRFSRVQAGTSVDFRGCACRWERSRKGKPVVKGRTARTKFHRALVNCTQGCRAHRSMPLQGLLRVLNAQLRGYDNYDGIIGNSNSLKAFFSQAMPSLWKWLNRRSQKRSYTWQRFEELLKRNRIERPRITDKPQTQPARSFAFR